MSQLQVPLYNELWRWQRYTSTPKKTSSADTSWFWNS